MGDNEEIGDVSVPESTEDSAFTKSMEQFYFDKIPRLKKRVFSVGYLL